MDGRVGSLEVGKDGEVCSVKPGVCDPDAPGVCVPKLDVCDPVIDPVCGCDDKTYSNACSAEAAGVSIKRKGACEAPPEK